MRKIIKLRCKNCMHVFRPRKRKRRYKCSKCGKEGKINKTFEAWTIKDDNTLMDILNPYDLETLRIAEQIKEAKARGATIKIIELTDESTTIWERPDRYPTVDEIPTKLLIEFKKRIQIAKEHNVIIKPNQTKDWLRTFKNYKVCKVYGINIVAEFLHEIYEKHLLPDDLSQ